MQRPHDLNESQWQAVCHKGSHLLITAGPGTGKTHTLTHRIARLIPSLKANESILAITFTNKAARQMKDRLTALGVGQSRLYVLENARCVVWAFANYPSNELRFSFMLSV